MKKHLLHIVRLCITIIVIAQLFSIINMNTFGFFFCVTLILQMVFVLFFCIGLVFQIKSEKPRKEILRSFLVIILILTVLQAYFRISTEHDTLHPVNLFVYLIYFSELFSMPVGLYALGNRENIFFLLRKRPVGQILTLLLLSFLLLPVIIGLVGGLVISMEQIALDLAGACITMLNTELFFHKYQNVTQQINGTDK